VPSYVGLRRAPSVKSGVIPAPLRTAFRKLPKNVRNHTGTLSAITSESCPQWIGIHVRLRPARSRGSVSGQGELKKLRFDPLFSLNHTCAMLRANLNRLFRRTWCMSKTIQGLIDHLSLYVIYHNLVLTPPHTAAITAKGGS